LAQVACCRGWVGRGLERMEFIRSFSHKMGVGRDAVA
jgi:hypothetical protein